MNSLRLSRPYFLQASCFCTPDKHVSRAMRFTATSGIMRVHSSCTQNVQFLSYSKSCARPTSSSALLRNILGSRCTTFPSTSGILFLHNRGYSSYNGSKQSDQHSPDGVTSVSGTQGSNDVTSIVSNTEWVDVLNNLRRSILDAAVSVGNKAMEISEEVGPYVHQFYYSHPYMETIVMPVAGILSANVAAWVVLPRVFQRLHKYTMQSPVAVLSGSSSKEQVAYERSLWSALEEPSRYLITFMAFSQLAVLLVPTASQYLSQAWRGAASISFVWFLYRWKTLFFSRAMANEITMGLDRDKLLTLERLSTVGLLIIGTMALAEASGVAVNSVLTVGGIGGVATAFAARDVLGNLLSGLSLQFSKPFSIGDYIKAGPIEGQVVSMGLTTTSLINSEKFPVLVPNSLFSSQVIVNKSRAKFRSVMANLPLRIQDLEKVPVVSEEIKVMLRSNPKVFLEADDPYCFLSRIDPSYVEVTLGCNLKRLRREELYAAQQEILVLSSQIIRKHGAELGSDQPNF